MDNDKPKVSQEDLERIHRLRLIDDEFMSICFDNYKEGAALLLRIILERDDLTVTEVKTQKELKNLQGHDIRLDIYATDRSGIKYDIEVQRVNKGAHRKRARYHSSMVDSNMLKSGEDFTELKESYVIFITENDVLGLNQPIYHIDRTIREGNVQFNDGGHIIYVNASMRTKETALGKLMSDFYCTESSDMCYKELADRVRQYKEVKEGVETMSEIWEEVRNEGIIKGRNEAGIEHAQRMIIDGTLPLEKIAEYSGLSIEKVRELADKKSA